MYSKFMNIFKYIVCGITVYLLFTYIPSNQMSSTDTTMITSIVLITYILMDYVSNNSTNTCNRENFK